MPGTGRLFYYVKNTVGRGIELEAGRWLKTWEVEKGRRMGKQSGEKGKARHLAWRAATLTESRQNTYLPLSH